ncbi:MAG: DUF3413 domain-containing protein [Proteobacteria bacterium]|nr:DUF3413 domain-containing protein [Pseudomonadota bacterium]
MTSGVGPSFKNWLKSPERKPLIQWGSWFFFFTGLIQVIIGLRYLSTYTFPQDAIGLIYTISAFFSHFIFISYLVWIVFILPLTIIIPKQKWIVPLSVLTSSLILSATLLDSLVFGDNRFHMSTLIMSILGMKTWLFGLVYLFIFFAFTTFLSGRVLAFAGKPGKRLCGYFISVICVLLLLLTHAIHIWADANYYTPVTRFTTYLPLYYPATAKRFMMKHGLASINQNRDEKKLNDLNDKHAKESLLYPINPLEYKTPEHGLNICVIVIDALRADAFTEALTPNLLEFSKHAVVFKNHYSGGNSSRMGAFSLFYGLPSTYWQYFEGISKTPVLIDRLQKENYQFGIFGSAPLYRPTSLDRTVFANIHDLRMETTCDIDASYARDIKITEEWMSWLGDRDKKQPFFGFLFFDAPTAKSYPPEYESRFPEDGNASKIEKKYRRYKTAVCFDDDLAGKVLRDLEERNLLNNTIVIITADHGEEFDDNEMGYAGHGSSYSRFQLKVPMIISWPGREARQIERRTSHNDIPATLLTEALGCTNPASDFCSGTDIFKGPEWEWMISGSYYNFAILEPDQITISYPGGYFEIRDNAYAVISNKHLNRKVLREALNESGRFYKK